MLAMIFNDDIKYNNILNDDFIDTYTSDYYEPENDGYIIVVKSINEEPYGTMNNPIRTYQRDEDFVFVYEIPDQYKTDYFCILKGDFDSISWEYKNKLLYFWDEINDEDEEDSLEEILFTKNLRLKKIYNYVKPREVYRVTPIT